MIENLYTQRSYVKCISEGYKFLADNLLMVCKVMVPYYLVSSVLLVLFNAVTLHGNVAIEAGRETTGWELIAAYVLLFLSVVAYIVAIRRLYIMFKRLCGITGRKRPNIKKVCKAMLKYCGKILGTVLLSLFSLVVISAVVYIPYVVATYTYFSSVEGDVNFGDTTIIPVYGYVLIILVCTLCYTVINIFSVAFYATLTFLYGDVRTRYTEKMAQAQVKKSLNDETPINGNHY